METLMRTSDFYYDLPQELIAQHPAEPRDSCRLLCVDRSSGSVSHRIFSELPGLLKKSPRLKIWSAACSNGSEPYTLAMILEKLAPGRGHRIIATDIDDNMLAKAKEGVYNINEIKNVPQQLRDRHFDKNGNEYKIHDSIKQRVDFRHHDLLKDRYESGFDLIVCRNVVIYFTDEAKLKIYTGFFNSLKTDGYLFVGGTERIHNYKAIGFDNPYPFFYRHP